MVYPSSLSWSRRFSLDRLAGVTGLCWLVLRLASLFVPSGFITGSWGSGRTGFKLGAWGTIVTSGGSGGTSVSSVDGLVTELSVGLSVLTVMGVASLLVSQQLSLRCVGSGSAQGVKGFVG